MKKNIIMLLTKQKPEQTLLGKQLFIAIKNECEQGGIPIKKTTDDIVEVVATIPCNVFVKPFLQNVYVANPRTGINQTFFCTHVQVIQISYLSTLYYLGYGAGSGGKGYVFLFLSFPVKTVGVDIFPEVLVCLDQNMPNKPIVHVHTEDRPDFDDFEKVKFLQALRQLVYDKASMQASAFAKQDTLVPEYKKLQQKHAASKSIQTSTFWNRLGEAWQQNWAEFTVQEEGNRAIQNTLNYPFIILDKWWKRQCRLWEVRVYLFEKKVQKRQKKMFGV
jgi:hypothetical protein